MHNKSYEVVTHPDSSSTAPVAMLPSNVWLGRHVCVIMSGASRGLGRQLALSLAAHFTDYHNRRCADSPANADTDYSLSFVLISRDAPALQCLSHQLSAIDVQHIHTVDIICGSLDDQITVQSFERTCETIANTTAGPTDIDSTGRYDQLIMIHNAGSLGDVNQLTADLGVHSHRPITQYLDLNLTSVMQMTGIFLRAFAAVPYKLVVNITSLAALQPFKGLSLYCIGKAGRDAFFRSVALENESVRVLSYSPGPLETDMVDILRKDGHLVSEFQRMDILKPETSVNRFIEILETNKYTSGDHVDYFQPIPV